MCVCVPVFGLFSGLCLREPQIHPPAGSPTYAHFSLFWAFIPSDYVTVHFGKIPCFAGGGGKQGLVWFTTHRMPHRFCQGGLWRIVRRPVQQ